ncbi:PP0621 family protein [Helicobacter suis]|uniref:PP0621 family protein n=1 Tax=Helicobacter suis TaxID=104628 RepID=UPI0013D57FBD|nr:PP0621 family protein [Helicobacter suis]
MLKFLLLLAIVGGVVWFLRSKKPKENNSQQVENLLECAHCKTYISSREALFSNGRAYCSQSCLQREI